MEIEKQPQGYFCEGQTVKEPIPIIPDTFSMTEETISNGNKIVSPSKVN
jgi:hypothetical protein